jgi:hypothetical protein
MNKNKKFIAGVFSLLVFGLAIDCCGQIFRGRLNRVEPTHQQPICSGPNCVGPTCVGPNCAPPIIGSESIAVNPIYSDPQPIIKTEVKAEAGIEEVSTATAKTPHVRCIYNGSCGSGTICGKDGRGAYVVTNAHVVGTAIGRVASVDIVSTSGSTQRIKGRIVMSGYSDRTMVDFAIMHCEGLTSERYMPLLKSQPEGAPYGTTGSPRCVWPQVVKAFNDPRNYGDGLITGTPDAIGGQSGSAIYNSNGQQIALLTWSISGRCAGQKTSKLWQVAQTRNVEVADVRPPELREVSDNPNRPETQVGVFGEMASLEPIISNRPETKQGVFGNVAAAIDQDSTMTLQQRNAKIGRLESGVQNVVGSAMAELPIWYDPNQPTDPTDPTDPQDPDCHKLTDKEWELIQFLREQAKESGIRDGAKERDWLTVLIKLMPLILEMIKAIQESK